MINTFVELDTLYETMQKAKIERDNVRHYLNITLTIGDEYDIARIKQEYINACDTYIAAFEERDRVITARMKTRVREIIKDLKKDKQ